MKRRLLVVMLALIAVTCVFVLTACSNDIDGDVWTYDRAYAKAKN